jgi:hypothetical protein
MPDVGLPASSAPPSHTTSEQWQSFEVRMRYRRAERCVQRAESALEAGMESDARAALEEARALKPDSPDIAALQSALNARRAAAAEAQRRVRARRGGAAGAAVGVAILGGLFAVWPLSEPAPSATIASPPAASGAALAAQPSTPSALAADASPTTTSVASVTQPPPPDTTGESATPTSGTSANGAAAPTGTVVREATPHTTAASTNTSATPPASDPPLPVLQPDAPPARPEPPLPRVASGDPQPVRAPAVDTGSIATRPPADDTDRLVKNLPSAAVPIARVPPPPAPPAPPPAEPTPSDEENVRAVLARFEAAYSALNAADAQAVWPSVDGRSLARAFASLDSQHVSLGRCSISVKGRSAAADCAGPTSWTPKVGGGRRTESRRWHFQLSSVNGRWRIDHAEARRTGS